MIELIFVLALLAICAVLVTARMGDFFRGRALSFEARRLLSLTHYAQSRAASEGVPMALWFRPSDATYGLTIQATFSDPEGDPHAVSYTVDPNVTLEVATSETADPSEQDDERLGMDVDGVRFIRFTPDGFFDDAGIDKIILLQGAEHGLEIAPNANRLGYEVRPLTNAR